jgi:3-phosphoshikimate 1-carboxyvinyltransferase
MTAGLETRAQAAFGLSATRGGPLKGRVRAPGDKSISHRALILGALATGTTEIKGLLEGDDVRRTAAAMAAFGAEVTRLGDGHWRVVGKGGFAEPADVVDCGNAGTGVRLIMGAAAGYDMVSVFTGDKSLRGRPMMRILRPLGLMGATWHAREGGRLPLALKGGSLKTITYQPPEPSAQVKSAVLLAGLNAGSGVEVFEAEATRDHTERMLRGFGAALEVIEEGAGRRIRLPGGQKLVGMDVYVPGDPSSAAFPLVAALIVPGSEVTVEGLLLNPSRIGLLDTLGEMGADLSVSNIRDEGGETTGDVTARYSALVGVEVPPGRAPSMIDEYPILAVAAAFASGRTVMRGIGELRVKESDRIALMAAGLASCGVTVQEEPAGLVVEGCGHNGKVAGGAQVTTHGDHRIAMSHLVLGLAADAPIGVDEPGMIATSFPTFVAMMRGLGGDLQGETGPATGEDPDA